MVSVVWCGMVWYGIVCYGMPFLHPTKHPMLHNPPCLRFLGSRPGSVQCLLGTRGQAGCSALDPEIKRGLHLQTSCLCVLVFSVMECGN